MHYYSHHINDYRGATAHLTNEEDLAYRRLLEMYYDTESPIPLETDWVARRLRVNLDAVLVALQDFFTKTEEGWMHGRCQREIESYRAMRDGGRNGAKKRWGSPSDRGGMATPSAPHDDPNSNQEPITKNHEQLTKNQEPGTREPKGKRQQAIACPPEVDPQVWSDWVQLRKTKRATVTQTVVDGARKEADKAGMSLTDFLAVWCRRGSQGLEAAWLKPEEKPKQSIKYDWLRSRSQVIDME